MNALLTFLTCLFAGEAVGMIVVVPVEGNAEEFRQVIEDTVDEFGFEVRSATLQDAETAAEAWIIELARVEVNAEYYAAAA